MWLPCIPQVARHSAWYQNWKCRRTRRHRHRPVHCGKHVCLEHAHVYHVSVACIHAHAYADLWFWCSPGNQPQEACGCSEHIGSWTYPALYTNHYLYENSVRVHTQTHVCACTPIDTQAVTAHTYLPFACMHIHTWQQVSVTFQLQVCVNVFLKTFYACQQAKDDAYPHELSRLIVTALRVGHLHDWRRKNNVKLFRHV